MRKLIELILIAAISLSSFSTLSAIVDYQAAAEDINNRLNKTLELYQSGEISQAKSKVQMAYFDVYESIEGPIRINYSQKYSYQLEAKFGEIRKMIADQESVEKVKTEIEWLKAEIATVPDILASGHQLVAENQNLNQEDILPFWRDQVQEIERTLNEALSHYRESAEEPGNAEKKREKAYDLIQIAQYASYKNSELETAIRLHRSMTTAVEYNNSFKAMTKITKEIYNQQKLIQFSYELSTLVQNLKDELPGLPATRDSQNPQDEIAVGVQLKQKDWTAVVTQISSAISASIQQYKEGQIDLAMMGVQDAYFDFFEMSGMENAIGARDASFKADLEGYFTRMVGMMKSGIDADELDSQLNLLSVDLNKGADMLSQGGHGLWAMLIASFTIIVREGLEALLIVAAITAYLIKNECQDKLYIIKNSVLVGLIASLITAGIFQWLFTNAGASRELLEGMTMLMAVVVLFFMSYWLLSKVEAAQWKNYLENKLGQSLTTGSLAGLWLASFLAVYREGAETVLFYYALAADADATSIMGLFAGLAIGIVVLVIVFFVMRHSVVKLPLKPFFMFTGGFMYFMAFVFSGKGVLELIEGKLFEPTLLVWAPEISLLGIYPYAETLIPQMLLIFAAALALVVIKRQGSQVQTA
ncbi:MAG: FTR1 family iron permease [Aliivibrio sp.]|uniref:FTR1 family iron permease n=1 Tax=Aliivibrio sp. TaxID=1872443 RepID=UPI001A44E533|nr:FTR1 family iron permease [Aliivibrio sp.]